MFEETLTTYEEIAPRYTRKVWPLVKAFLNSSAGKVLVDVGCGRCSAGVHWVGRGAYLGIDASVAMLESSPKKLKEEALSWRVAALAENLPIRDEIADSALMIAVLHHIETRQDRIKALSELRRVLRRGGRVLITVWAGLQASLLYEAFKALLDGLGKGLRDFLRCSKVGCRYYHLYTLRALIGEVREAGLKVLEAGSFVAPGKGRARRNYYVVAIKP